MFILLLSFFFNDPATTEIYTLSLHDALPISLAEEGRELARSATWMPTVVSGSIDLLLNFARRGEPGRAEELDRKSTRLNSSHSQISYAVFCLKKKKNTTDLLDV